jgi:hypothetical protein
MKMMIIMTHNEDMAFSVPIFEKLTKKGKPLSAIS